jgi:hypothetical protein
MSGLRCVNSIQQRLPRAKRRWITCYPTLSLVSAYLQSFVCVDHRPSLCAWAGVDARTGRQRRVLRQRAPRSFDGRAFRRSLSRRRAIPQQDRIIAVASAPDSRQLRRPGTHVDAGSVHASRRRRQLRELDVGDSARALQGRCDQQLQRRPAGAGQAPLGPFFELETSSPALDLLPAKHYTHVHRTFHLVGPEAELDRIARATINVGLDELVNAFSGRR